MKYRELYEYNNQNKEFISQISLPLFNYFNYKFLAYRRFILKDNKIIYLIGDDKWREILFTNQLWFSHSFQRMIRNFDHKDSFFNVWPDTFTKNDLVYDLLFENDIWNGIVLYHKTDDWIETFCFVGDKNSIETKNFFINNIHILNDFTNYLKVQIHYLLKNIKVDICINFESNLFRNNQADILEKNNLECFYNTIDSTKYLIRINGNNHLMTRREKECLSALSAGQSIKEAANTLSLSPRTVEYYVNNLKFKTGSSRTIELIKIYLQQIERNYAKIW